MQDRFLREKLLPERYCKTRLSKFVSQPFVLEMVTVEHAAVHPVSMVAT